MSKQNTAITTMTKEKQGCPFDEDITNPNLGEKTSLEYFNKETPFKNMKNTFDIQSLIDRNYNATKKRGQITPETDFDDFIVKIAEEFNELLKSYDWKAKTFDPKELGDLILVCLSKSKHFNIDIMQVLSDKVDFNEKRED